MHQRPLNPELVANKRTPCCNNVTVTKILGLVADHACNPLQTVFKLDLPTPVTRVCHLVSLNHYFKTVLIGRSFTFLQKYYCSAVPTLNVYSTFRKDASHKVRF